VFKLGKILVNQQNEVTSDDQLLYNGKLYKFSLEHLMTEVTSQNISYKMHFRVPDCLENFTAHGNCESFEFYVTVTWSVMTNGLLHCKQVSYCQ